MVINKGISKGTIHKIAKHYYLDTYIYSTKIIRVNNKKNFKVCTNKKSPYKIGA